MTASWHVVTKLLTVSRMSKVDYQNKVLPNIAVNNESSPIVLFYLQIIYEMLEHIHTL